MAARFGWKHATLLAAATLGVSLGSARAEVRLLRPADGRARAVSVSVGDRGAWEPSGRIDGTVLNPLGAMRGDGAPAVAVSGRGVIVAWTDTAAGATSFAVGDRSWRLGSPLADASVTVMPRVAPLGDAFLLARSRVTGAIEVAVVDCSTAVVATHVVGEGDLLNLALVGDTYQLVTADPTGRLAVIVLGITVPDPQPSPYEFRTLRTVMLPGVAIPAAAPALQGATEGVDASGISVLPAHSSSTERSQVQHAGLAAQRMTGARDINATAGIQWSLTKRQGGKRVDPWDVVILDPEAASRSESALAAWWSSPTTLQFVVLEESAVRGPETVTGRGDFSPSLVREALRIAGE